MFNQKWHIPLWLKLAVSAGLLWFFFSRTDVPAVFIAISSIPLAVLGLLLFLNIAGIYLNAIKWKWIAGTASVRKLAQANFVAQYYSLVLPGQIAGEVSKIFYLRRHDIAAAPELTASVGIDKMTGLIGAVFIVGSVGALTSSFPLPLVVKAIFILGFLVGMALIFFLRIPTLYHTADALLTKVRLGGVQKMLSHWRAVTSRPWRIAASIVFGIFYQFLSIAVVMIIASPLGIHVGFFDWCWILSILSVILLLPISIGGLGVREGSLVALLGLFGVAPQAALALSLTLFGLQTVLALIGAVYEHIPVPVHE